MNTKKQKYDEAFYKKLQEGIKRVFDKFETTFETKVALNSLFENISGIFENPQSSNYDLNKILKGNEFFSTVKEFPQEGLKFFVEFISYPKALGGMILAVSTIKFDEVLPIDASLFALKEEMVEKIL